MFSLQQPAFLEEIEDGFELDIAAAGQPRIEEMVIRERDMSLKVLVIGGGIGGLALAQGLRRVGPEVAVYERDRTPADRLRGYRIHLKPSWQPGAAPLPATGAVRGVPGQLRPAPPQGSASSPIGCGS